VKNTTKKLKSVIKELASKKVSTSTERRAYKNKASKEYKQAPEYQYWFELSDEKRTDLRYEIRHYLLAYALLRGRPYKTVEKKCASGNKPSVRDIEKCIDYCTDFEALEDVEKLETLKASVRHWLATQATESPPGLEEVAA